MPRVTVLAELPRDLVAMQCDICVPPVLTINTYAELRRTAWELRADGGPWDVCSNCATHIPRRRRVARRDAEPVLPDPARLPNVVVVGALKAGTTSMHNYLDLHPEIAVSADKEMRFFQDPDCLRWLGTYQASFATGTRCRAESTPFYAKTPAMPGVVDRMADMIPDARLLYLVRDPVDRIVAEYVEQMQWGAASRSLEAELVDADDPRNWLVASSRYATQLRELRRRFAADRIKVIDLADLGKDTAAVMADVFAFLGLDPIASHDEDFRRFNSREEKSAFPDWLHALRRGPVMRVVNRIPERPRRVLTEFAWRRVRTPIETPQLSDRDSATLHRVLKPEADELRELTGGTFSTWSV